MDKPTLGLEHVEILSERPLYQGHFHLTEYKLRFQKFAGDKSEILRREVLRTRPAAGVLPYDPVRDEVVLIEQMRVGALTGHRSPWMYEVIAGVIEPDDDHVESRIRQEAIEEANLSLGKLVPMHQYWVSPGCSAEHYMLYCAEVDATTAHGVHGNEHEGEDIRVHVFSREEAIRAVEDGTINNGSTLIALQWLMMQSYRGNLTTMFT